MKRKLIESTQPYLIVCDNPQCDYKIDNPTGQFDSDVSIYLNMPCPECGENLLTQEDYVNSLKMIKVVKFLNRWFSWITYLIPNSKKKEVQVKCHDGIHIK